jgi:hypothetical protein
VSYYLAVLVISVNLALAAVAYLQRAKQIRGNALREQQLDLLGEIRDAVRTTVRGSTTICTSSPPWRSARAANASQWSSPPPGATARLRNSCWTSSRQPRVATRGSSTRTTRHGSRSRARRWAGGRLGADGAFVCDVGGGSTEVAFGSSLSRVTASASFDVGAFALAERYFRHDPPTPDEIEAARIAAAQAVTLDLGSRTRLALATGGSAHALSRCSNAAIGRPLTIVTGGLREGVLLELARA